MNCITKPLEGEPTYVGLTLMYDLRASLNTPNRS